MTRINVVHQSELTDKHLLAEYRELRRVFTLIEKWQARGCPARGVSEYRMGPGHVMFFYDKAMWLALRFEELVTEMERRGFKPLWKSQMHRVKKIGYKGQADSLYAPWDKRHLGQSTKNSREAKALTGSTRVY